MPKCGSVSNFDLNLSKKELKNAERVMLYIQLSLVFSFRLGAASEGNLNQDIHHRSNPCCSNPFEGLLSRPVSFSAHKIWRVISRSDCADRTYGQPYPQGYCASCSFPHADSHPHTPSSILWFSLL
ncbi:hypothetical protein AVEN_65407-1 [Araneus ventricosus]|uniref:Uncharacterized protein n=1 Tax=Araneus ventricosus TaxID=182803 RepID=A0A4Y2RR70_ARAVE|nr:hypothetical protein AVEN_65407-1 [Araneus ventricosus]